MLGMGKNNVKMFKKWGIDVVPMNKQPLVDDVFEMCKRILGILKRETHVRWSTKVIEAFPGFTLHWLRAMLSIVMCGVGISGSTLHSATRLWRSPELSNVMYDPDGYIYLIKRQLNVRLPYAYINKYYKVSKNGWQMLMIRYGSNFDKNNQMTRLQQLLTEYGNDFPPESKIRIDIEYEHYFQIFQRAADNKLLQLTRLYNEGILTQIRRWPASDIKNCVTKSIYMQSYIRRIDPTQNIERSSVDRLKRNPSYSLWIYPAVQGFCSNYNLLIEKFRKIKFLNPTDDVTDDEADCIVTQHEFYEPHPIEETVVTGTKEWYRLLTDKIISSNSNFKNKKLTKEIIAYLSNDDENTIWYKNRNNIRATVRMLGGTLTHVNLLGDIWKMFSQHYDFQRTSNDNNEIGWGPSGKRTRSSYKINDNPLEDIENPPTKYIKKKRRRSKDENENI